MFIGSLSVSNDLLLVINFNFVIKPKIKASKMEKIIYYGFLKIN